MSLYTGGFDPRASGQRRRSDCKCVTDCAIYCDEIG